MYKAYKIDDSTFEAFCIFRKGAKEDKHYERAYGASFFYANCHEVKDLSWGCAWRSIQICASSLGLLPTFKELFEYRLDKTKPQEWAEPGYGKRYLDEHNIPNQVKLYKRDKGTPKTPEFSKKPIEKFLDLRKELIKHFATHKTPVMADDEVYTMTIVGIRVNSEDETILFMADPHKTDYASGLYYVALNQNGEQIIEGGKPVTSGVDFEDQRNGLCSVKLAHFNKGWMLLFPQPNS